MQTLVKETGHQRGIVFCFLKNWIIFISRTKPNRPYYIKQSSWSNSFIICEATKPTLSVKWVSPSNMLCHQTKTLFMFLSNVCQNNGVFGMGFPQRKLCCACRTLWCIFIINSSSIYINGGRYQRILMNIKFLKSWLLGFDSSIAQDFWVPLSNS